MTDDDDARTIAKAAAHEVLISLGIDPDDHKATQRDMAFLRGWRESSDAITRQGIVTATILAVSGFLGLLYMYFRGGGP